MAKEYKITSLRLADLEKELNYLKTTREREIAAIIKPDLWLSPQVGFLFAGNSNFSLSSRLPSLST